MQNQIRELIFYRRDVTTEVIEALAVQLGFNLGEIGGAGPWKLIINWLKKQLKVQEIAIIHSYNYGINNYYIITELGIRKLNNNESII